MLADVVVFDGVSSGVLVEVLRSSIVLSIITGSSQLGSQLIFLFMSSSALSHALTHIIYIM